VVGAIAGVVRAIASVVGVVADEDVVDADRIYASSVATAVKLLTRGGPGDLSDGEREAVHHGHEVRDDDHLAHLGSCLHTPYLAPHCR
jgi:hypothetical protein